VSNQTAATRVCKDILEPGLRRAGFEGTFPAFHRLGKQSVETVFISIYVRGGVEITLGSVPLRAKLALRTAKSDVASTVPDARREALKLRAQIFTAADMRALPAKLTKLLAQVKQQGATFWARHDGDLVERQERSTVAAAIESADPRRLKLALAALTKRRAQTILDQHHIHHWHERATILRLYAVAPVLSSWRPPWMLGSVLAAGAALSLARRGPAKAHLAVLEWIKPHVRRVQNLAGQVAILADHLIVGKDVAAALTLFELVIDSANIGISRYGNALWTVLGANNKQAIDSARHRRFIRAALAQAGDDASVHFNCACAYVELGNEKKAADHLARAIELGASLELVKAEPLLRNLRVTARPGKPIARRGFVTHGAPRRR